MDFSETEDARVEMHNPHMVRGTENNYSQQWSMTRDDYVSSQDDIHIFLWVNQK